MVYAPIGAMAAADPVAQALMQPADPFVWGQGGAKMTPQQVAMLRAQGEGLSQSDYSPVGHWTQGLGRVLDSVDGGLKMKRAEKMEGENREYQQRMAEALATGEVSDEMIARVLMDPNADAGAQNFAAMQMKARQPAQPGKPHFWETNNGSLGMVDPATGKPTILYEDPTPKINWVTADNPDGTKSLIPVGPNGPMQGGGGQTSTGPQPGTIEDGYRFKGGDPADQSNWEEVASSNAGGTF